MTNTTAPNPSEKSSPEKSSRYALEVTCSVCFRDHVLNPGSVEVDRPIRHGFRTYECGRGSVGGWHTGPCEGVRFPHFGISTAGTKWALAQVHAALEVACEALDRLRDRPSLTWVHTPTIRAGRKLLPDCSRELKVVLDPGCLARCERVPSSRGGTLTIWVPSYEDELASRLVEAQRRVDALTTERHRYERAIDDWKPAPARPVKADKAVHLGRRVERPNASGTSGYDVPSCDKRVPKHKAEKLASRGQLTSDLALVTCKRCGVSRP